MLDLETFLRLFVVLLLVLANGFFVASEFSLVAVRRSRIEQLVADGNPFAPAVQHGVQHLDLYLAACQLGITIASISLGWIGEPALADLIEPAFHALPADWALVGSHTLALAIAFSIITALHIILGELAPKSLALQRTEGTALAVALPLRLFLTAFRPAIFLLNSSGNLLLRIAGLRPASVEEQVHSVEELRYLVAASREAGVLDEVESQIVHRAFNLGEIRANEVMVPRTEMVAVDSEASLDRVLEIMSSTGHSRLPVYERDPDNVVGVTHLRDLVYSPKEQGPVRRVMRQPLFLPETTNLEEVLLEMRRQRTQFAVLVDEHGGTAGLVTLENLLEAIVGELHDEFDLADETIRPQEDGTVLIDGLLSLRELSERFGLKLPEGESSTVGGLLMARLGRIAQVGDDVLLDGYRLTVEAMDGLRVAIVRLIRD